MEFEEMQIWIHFPLYTYFDGIEMVSNVNPTASNFSTEFKVIQSLCPSLIIISFSTFLKPNGCITVKFTFKFDLLFVS